MIGATKPLQLESCNDRMVGYPWQRLELVVDPARLSYLSNSNRGHLGLIPAHTAKRAAGYTTTRANQRALQHFIHLDSPRVGREKLSR